MSRNSLVRSIIRGALLTVVLTALSGCWAWQVGDFENLTAGPFKKRELLSKNVDDYHRALYWGSLDEAATFIHPEAVNTVMQRARTSRDRERLVTFQIDDVQMDDIAAQDATVMVNVKYFRNGAYVVESRKEREFWEFSRVNGGWRISDVEVVEAGKVAEAGLLR